MKLYNHEVLALGGLKPKSDKVAFIPDSTNKSLYERTRNVVKQAEKLELIWILESANGKIKPLGVGLVTTKQIIAPSLVLKTAWHCVHAALDIKARLTLRPLPTAWRRPRPGAASYFSLLQNLPLHCLHIQSSLPRLDLSLQF